MRVWQGQESQLPEGHTIHRAARDHNSLLAAQKLTVLSPQGRFTEGAARLTGRVCINIEAFGKHLIYHFDGGQALHGSNRRHRQLDWLPGSNRDGGAEAGSQRLARSPLRTLSAKNYQAR